MFSASETYCWISSPFLVLSELWLAGSTQLFWLKLLSKLTDSIWLLSASHWIALLGLKLTLAICSNLLAPSHSLAHSVFTCVWLVLSATCLCTAVPAKLPPSSLCTSLSFLLIGHSLSLIHSGGSFSDLLLSLPLRSHFQTWAFPSTN